MPIFAATAFISAFLLFALQPMVAKSILPSFGGTAAVWATSMVIFQTLLLVGYAYTHLLRLKLSPLQQRWTHLAVLCVALFFLPPMPQVHPASAIAHPVGELLRSVIVSVGVPFFALSATAPLLMEWFRQSFPNRTADRLYAFSNAGSLLALISYPILLEPNLGIKRQALCWSGGLGIFLVVCGLTAIRSRRQLEKGHLSTANAVAGKPISLPEHAVTPIASPAWLWISLAACSSALLLSLTNQITQDVAPMPLLWVAPLGIYLLTFILCFESTKFYRRTLFMPACFGALLLLAWLLQEGYLHGFGLQISGYLAVLFCSCMLCHGELYRLRPPAERLTQFYLLLALGGALGGMFVALLAPALFDSLIETPLLALAIPALITVILWKESKSQKSSKRAPNKFISWQTAMFGTLLIVAAHGVVQFNLRERSIYFTRSFYGPYRVTEGPQLLLDKVFYPLNQGSARVLYSGQIYHGLQFTAPEASTIATTYYSDESGLGLVFRNLPTVTNRVVGAIGLGAGTLATYGKAGDRFQFYELSPDVLRIAETHFTFLTNCPASLEAILGDARVSLERQPPQNFDLLVLDAFSGDSVPVHLLTAEAMEIYARHLKTNGVMAFHISNSHLDLDPVVRALAQQRGLTMVIVPSGSTDIRSGKLPSIWAIVTANPTFLRQPEVLNIMAQTSRIERRAPLLWTDDHSTVLPLLQ